jgi:DNA primase catalytic core
MPLDKEVIAQAKRTELAALVQAKGIDLKKNGKSLLGLCPFHADKNPSLSINTGKNLWQCFGCGAGGDAIRFVELFDQVDFAEAVIRLTGGPLPKTGGRPPAARDRKKGANALSVKDKKLLARVVKYYRHSFEQDRRGLEYLQKERRINDLDSIKDFGAGYVNGTLTEILPHDPDVIKQLKKIGILSVKGNEIFYNCVVFPLYDGQKAVSGLYGRNIDPKADAPHLYLAGPRSGLINRAAVKRSQTIFLTESIIDALTLYDQGFKNTIPIYGVNGLIDEHLKLLSKRIDTVYLVFDSDPAGKRAADAVSARLKEKKITSHIVTLPAKDVNIYFNRHSAEQFETLLKSAHPGAVEQSQNVQTRKQDLYKPTDHGFIAGFGGRQYEVKGISRSDTQLKVTVKASTDVQRNKPFELTTIDLYSSKSRTWFGKLCADLFAADESLVKEDMAKLLDLVEHYRPAKKQDQPAKPSNAEKAAAMKLLTSKDMFAQILSDLETLGVTGETTNKLVGYLAAVSRKLDEPLSVLIQSRSAAGKSTLQDAILSLVPDEDYVKYTRVTDQALFYKEKESLMHRILAIEEAVGMGGAAYSIRNIQSSKKITIATTGKDAKTGEMKTEEHEVLGPVAVMITTTAADLEGETASRFLFLTVDESVQMTAAIHAKQREAQTLEGLVKQKQTEHIIKKHHTAQRLLKPLAVVNPYAKYLSYPDHSIRTRRDHKKYLGLIRTIAYLHQYQRKTNTVAVEGEPVAYIEVTLADIDQANILADRVLGQSLDELAPPSRTLLELILEMVMATAKDKQCPVNEVYFTRRRIREYTGWSDWQVREHIKQLEQLEYLYVRVGSQGKQYAYALNYKGQGDDAQRFYLNLTTVAQIKERMKKDTS